MKINGAATLGFALFDMESAISHLAELGFKGVELSYMGRHSRHMIYRQTDPAAVASLLSSYNMTPVSMNIYTHGTVDGRIVSHDYTNPDDAADATDQACWYLEAASAMNVKTVTLGIARRIFGARWQQVMKAFCASFIRVTDLAAKLDIRVNLEVPHLFLITDTVDHVKAVFEQLDHPNVAATVDSSHWGIAGYDLDAFFSWLGPRLRHVHLRDSAGSDTRDEKQKLELTPGKGTVDFVRFRKALESAGFAGRVTLDFEYKVDDPTAIKAEYRSGLAHLAECGWVLE